MENNASFDPSQPWVIEVGLFDNLARCEEAAKAAVAKVLGSADLRLHDHPQEVERWVAENWDQLEPHPSNYPSLPDLSGSRWEMLGLLIGTLIIERGGTWHISANKEAKVQTLEGEVHDPWDIAWIFFETARHDLVPRVDGLFSDSQ